jgi:hypothetical protein
MYVGFDNIPQAAEEFKFRKLRELSTLSAYNVISIMEQT